MCIHKSIAAKDYFVCICVCVWISRKIVENTVYFFPIYNKLGLVFWQNLRVALTYTKGDCANKMLGGTNTLIIYRQKGKYK